MPKLITFIVVIAVALLQARLVPFSVRRNWIRIAAFGRLQKRYGSTIYISPTGNRAELSGGKNPIVTIYFSPYKRLMNGLTLVIVALIDWLCFTMLIALFVSLFGN